MDSAAICREGPIPAGAGETTGEAVEVSSFWAYPRWRGGNNDFVRLCVADGGLSPLARGKRFGVSLMFVWLGPIPAGAGETP